MTTWTLLKKEFKKIYNILRGQTVNQLTENMTIENLGYMSCLIQNWVISPIRKDQLTGEYYYRGDQSILKKVRKGIDERGLEITLDNIPNYQIVNNLYGKMVKQKAFYIASNPISFQTENQEYLEQLRSYFSEDWDSQILDLAIDVLNGGIAYIHPYYNEQGELKFKNYSGYEVMPGWVDDRHTKLDYIVRIYDIEVYNGGTIETRHRAEVYAKDFVKRYAFDNNVLSEEVIEPYIIIQNGTLQEQVVSWGKLPIIPFKRDSKEMPLIKNCKSLQDSINQIMSVFCDVMEQDNNNSVLVVVNFDGENVNQLRDKINKTRVIPVRSVDGTSGDVKTLQMEVNSENYKSVLSMLEKAFIKNCQGYDIDNDILTGGDINQMKIKTAFSEIDLDARAMVKEFNKSMKQLIWFVNRDIERKTGINYDEEELQIIFNLDIIVNESEQLDNCVKLGIKLSERTKLRNCSWVLDVEEELKQIEEEQKKLMEQSMLNPMFENTDEEETEDEDKE